MRIHSAASIATSSTKRLACSTVLFSLSVLLLACSPAEHFSGGKNPSKMPTAIDFESTTVEVNDVELHYLTSGENQPKKTMIFLHGFPHIAEVWYPLLNHFSDEYRVIAPDLRGYGRSGKPAETTSYKIDTLVNDICELIAEVSPRQPVILVGHDWGGVIAWGIAQTQPHLLDKLVVINAPQFNAFLHTLNDSSAQRETSKYIHKLDSWVARLAFWWKGPELLWRGLEEPYKQGKVAHEYKVAFFEQWGNSASAAAAVNYYTENFPLFESINEADFWPSPDTKATTQALLIWSINDKAFTSDALFKTQQFATRLTTHLIDTDSHTPFLSHSEEVITSIEKFIKQEGSVENE